MNIIIKSLKVTSYYAYYPEGNSMHSKLAYEAPAASYRDHFTHT